MPKKKIRPSGQIYLELEELIDELIDSHDIQHGDFLAWALQHLRLHRPDAAEEFVSDNTHPVFFYGHERDLIIFAAKIARRRKNEKKDD